MSSNACARVSINGVFFKPPQHLNQAARRPAATTAATNSTPSKQVPSFPAAASARSTPTSDKGESFPKQTQPTAPKTRPTFEVSLAEIQARVVATPKPKSKSKQKSALAMLRSKGPSRSFTFGTQGPAAAAARAHAEYMALPSAEDDYTVPAPQNQTPSAALEDRPAVKRQRKDTEDVEDKKEEEEEAPKAKKPKTYFFKCLQEGWGAC